jgi:hypothetical protein
MNFLINIIIALNSGMNAVGKLLLAPLMAMPGWQSNAIISVIAGVLLMLLFKYTSNQSAIGRVRDRIKAHMLVLKLFKDSIAVTLQAQGTIFKGAFLLIFYALRPMLVMMLPVSLLLSQLSLFYQARPLLPNEEAIVIMQLADDIGDDWPDITIASMDAARISIDKTIVYGNKQLLWKIQAEKPGISRIVFQVGDEQVEKELAIGDGFMRTSIIRPGHNLGDLMLHPWETPFAADSVVQSITIEYPDRISKTSGTDWWIGYFLVVSMIAAVIFIPVFKVRI